MIQEKETALIKRAKSLGTQVGNTPLVRLGKLLDHPRVQLWAKQEWHQLSGSVKSRAAYFIIMDALQKGALDESKTLLDATSGNTGIAYAAIGAALGIRVALCLPENASKERKDILQSLGAEIIYTSKFEGTDGAQEVAADLAQTHPDKYFYADQYKNENNWKAHYHTTGEEIIRQVPHLTHFVAGLGTTGTFIGTSRKLREYNSDIQCISFQPDNPMHGLEGWKHLETATVPRIYDPLVADQNIEVSTEESYEMLKKVYRDEGLLISPSSAANLAGAVKLANTIDKGTIVTVLPDNADKYSEVVKKLIP